MKILRTKNFLILILLFVSSLIQASPLEDVFGMGPRTQAMGGAGVASSNDPSGIFYNPANLSRCPTRMVVSGISLVSSNLRAFREVGSNIPTSQVGNMQFGHLGGCFIIFPKITFGFHVASQLRLPMNMGTIGTPNSTPQFLFYNSSLLGPSAMFGFSYEPIKYLSLGFGATLAGAIEISQKMSLPVVESSLDQEIKPIIGLIAGILAGPFWDQLSFGLVYRHMNNTEFTVDANIDVDPLGNVSPGLVSSFEANLTMAAKLNYTPSQIALGINYEPSSSWKITADITYALWSLYEGPFLQVTADKPTFANNRLTVPKKTRLNYKNIFTPRFGAEYALNKKVMLRAGYAFIPSPIPEVKGELFLPEKGSLIYSSVHRVTLGMGYEIYSSKDIKLHMDAFMALDAMGQTTVKQLGPNNKVIGSYNFEGAVANAGVNLKIDY